MKFKMMGLLVAGMCMLSACSEIEETAAEPEKVEEPKKEVPKTEEPKKEAPRAEAPKEEKPAPEPVSAKSELEYQQFSISTFQALPENFQAITDLITDATQDPLLLFDDNWKTDVVINYEMVTDKMQAMIDYEGVPEKYKEVHEYTVKAAHEYIASKEKFYYGVDNMDPDSIFEATNHMDQGNAYIDEATILLEEMNGQ
ncbi:hypothetical protein HMPREF3291_05145 [Bacillus sp. HMSC76G11]|nr:hypothetical protein HMPREF3291_05145 [Bacillus sp. HMSC76G11]